MQSLTTARPRPLAIAREPRAGYDHTPVDAPLEVPPALREALGLLGDVDRALARVLRLLIGLQATGQVETDTGLPLEAWLAQAGRMLRTDRTFLTIAADVLTSMPATLACFADGTLSWSQTRAIVTAVRGLRTDQRTTIDHEIAAAAHQFTTWDPEQLCMRVELIATETELATTDPDPDSLLEPPHRPTDLLVLQPRIDGTGGKLWGDYHDPIAFGTIENALSERMGRPDTLEPTLDAASRARNRDRIGHARAHAQVDICARSLSGDHHTPATPLLLATTTLESLLGLSHTPGRLLTRMTGGTLTVDAATLRHLVDHGGAQVRTIVLDDVGRAIGVGHKAYVPPGWLRQTILALQHHCATPGCRTAARLCDLDHIQPWPHGPTDTHNLQFSCRRHHRAKTAGHWQVTVLPDGTRRHRHLASGLTTHVPLTTRPHTTPAPQPPRRP